MHIYVYIYTFVYAQKRIDFGCKNTNVLYLLIKMTIYYIYIYLNLHIAASIAVCMNVHVCIQQISYMIYTYSLNIRLINRTKSFDRRKQQLCSETQKQIQNQHLMQYFISFFECPRIFGNWPRGTNTSHTIRIE